MKKVFLLRHLCIAILLIAVSCKKDSTKSLSPPQPIAQVLPDSNAVPMSIASIVAVQNGRNISQIVKKSDNSIASLQTKQILDSLAVPDKINASYYVFNYVGGGFAIISADKRVQPILAFGDKGYFKTSGEIPPGLGNWLSVNHKNMQLVKKNRQLKASKRITKLWAHFITNNLTIKGKQAINNVPIDTCREYFTDVIVGPLLQTEWDQGYPYNALCPVGAYSLGHTPTGCVATAMAQVMYYWKYPATYAWSSMPQSYSTSICYPLAQLMLDAGNSVHMVYDDNGSAPYTSFPFNTKGILPSTGLKNNFQYGSASGGDYDYQAVQNNINSGWPVIITASTDTHSFLFWDWYNHGHAWVCDGYDEYTVNFCATESSPGYGATYLHFHMNWGWGGFGNGYYGNTTWEVFDGTQIQNYQYNQTMDYNIHP